MESVWDYPRPPRLERTDRQLRVVHRGVTIAETRHAYRVLETSHPPVYYIAQSSIDMQRIVPASGSSFCEWKGSARYYDVNVDGVVSKSAAWSYDHPSVAFAAIAGYLAFYASRVDECTVDGERVVAQPGDFYGGWITSDLQGPFKGGPGSRGW